MEVDEATSDGFRGRFRPESKPADSEKSWQDLIFEAPGIVRYRGTPIENFVFGGALHCMPLGVGRSRLLFRTYYSSRGGIPRVARWVLASRTERESRGARPRGEAAGPASRRLDSYRRAGSNPPGRVT